MSFFKNIFSSSKKASNKENIDKPKINLPLDENFVQEFTAKKGKFLYCIHQEDVNQNLANIFEENSWENALCFDEDLQKMLMIAGVNSTEEQTSLTPFFTTCEHLIAKDGSLLFSSNQLKEIKLKDLPIHFIVFAKTSQIVTNNDDALMNIKNIYKGNLPSNISPIKNYDPNNKSDDILISGNSNSKNLYLLLLEDL
jgi:hypothetical protein